MNHNETILFGNYILAQRYMVNRFGSEIVMSPSCLTQVRLRLVLIYMQITKLKSDSATTCKDERNGEVLKSNWDKCHKNLLSLNEFVLIRWSGNRTFRSLDISPLVISLLVISPEICSLVVFREVIDKHALIKTIYKKKQQLPYISVYE